MHPGSPHAQRVETRLKNDIGERQVFVFSQIQRAGPVQRSQVFGVRLRALERVVVDQARLRARRVAQVDDRGHREAAAEEQHCARDTRQH